MDGSVLRHRLLPVSLADADRPWRILIAPITHFAGELLYHCIIYYIC